MACGPDVAPPRVCDGPQGRPIAGSLSVLDNTEQSFRAYKRLAMSYDWDRFFEVLSPALPGWWQLLLVGLGLTVLIWLTLRFRAWSREDAAHADCSIDLLSDLREMHRQGGLTEEEYRLVKTRLAQTAAGKLAPPRTAAAVKSSSARPADVTHRPSPPAKSPGQDGTLDQEPVGPTATDAAEHGPGRAPRESAP